MQTYALLEIGFVSLNDVLTVVPVSKSTWWAGIREGRYPAPVKISRHRVAWRAEDINALIARLGADAETAGA